MNDLISDLGLTKDRAEHVSSAVKEEGNLEKGTKSSNEPQSRIFENTFILDRNLHRVYKINQEIRSMIVLYSGFFSYITALIQHMNQVA